MASSYRLLSASSPPRQQPPPCPTALCSFPPPLLADLPLHRHAPDPPPLFEPSNSLPSSPPRMLESPQNLLLSAQPPTRDAGGTAWFSLGWSSSSAARFLSMMYNLVDDEGTDSVISWNARGDGFVVWDTRVLCQILLPRYFRHADFASFIRQLTSYGFRKINPERWEFVKSDFLRGHRHLLGQIHRKASANAGAPRHHHHHRQPQNILGSSSPNIFVFGSEASLQAGKYGIREELDLLKTEVCGLRNQLQQTEGQCKLLWQRLQMAKSREKLMIRFFVRARHDPSLLSGLAQQSATENLKIPKQQRRKVCMRDDDTASGICDARREKKQSRETRRSVKTESVNESQTQLTPCPLREQKSDSEFTEVAECSSQEGKADADDLSSSS